MSKYNETDLIKRLHAKDTRIAELEQCIRENYEALRDKKGKPMLPIDKKTAKLYGISSLSIHEQCFMSKAESLIPTLMEGKE